MIVRVQNIDGYKHDDVGLMQTHRCSGKYCIHIVSIMKRRDVMLLPLRWAEGAYTYVWPLRGELTGEPNRAAEDGRSSLLRSRSTSRSKLNIIVISKRSSKINMEHTYLRDFCLKSAASRSARRFASCKLFSEVCLVSEIRTADYIMQAR